MDSDINIFVNSIGQLVFSVFSKFVCKRDLSNTCNKRYRQAIRKSF